MSLIGPANELALLSVLAMVSTRVGGQSIHILPVQQSGSLDPSVGEVVTVASSQSTYCAKASVSACAFVVWPGTVTPAWIGNLCWRPRVANIVWNLGKL